MGALRLIRSVPPFRRLWTARSISFLGDSLSLVALMVYVADTTGQALAVALLLLVGDFAPALLGPLTGVIADRFELRRVMIVSELAQAALIAVIALGITVFPLPLILALVALRSIAGHIFQPASRAVVPALVRDRDLEGANAAIGFGTNGGEALGPLLAALLLPLLDVRGVLLIDAASFLLSAALLAFLPAARPSAPDEPTTILNDAITGLRHIVATPLLRAIGLGFIAVVACNGIDDVALVFLTKDTLHGGDSAVGLLLAAVGLGLFAGYALLARPRLALPVLLLAGFAISSAGNLLTGFAWAVGAAFAVQATRGIGLAAMDVATNTLIQRNVPAPLLGRIFGSLYGAVGVAAALSYLGGGLLLDLTSPRTAFIAAGTGGLLVTLATAVALRRADGRIGSEPIT
ncbi:MFS transporter [Actinomadura rudentiformis]|uniref:MFS transporter n=2 Tax=Actinomadura rudentiformis TaxID=359158 RepID=A0A6H9YHD6_9ACTN|nr:MFS transporter [Actinomadura rudentiformis]